jgi:hypothetical protein
VRLDIIRAVSAAPYPEIIYPFAQSPDTVMTLVVRTAL